MTDLPGDYECENQMDLEEYLWGIGYYLPVPEGNEEQENGSNDDI